MAGCTRQDVSERLVMALWPDEFPKEQPRIEEHLRDCLECRKELDMLRALNQVLGKNRDELAPCLAACPSTESLVDFALGQRVDRSIEEHIAYCADCRAQFELVRELPGEEILAGSEGKLSAAEKLRIQQAISQEYAPSRLRERRSLREAISDFIAAFHVPSLALGAVVAALLLVVVMPWGPREAPLSLVLSDVSWDAGVITKSADEALHPVKKVALVILRGESAPLTDEDIENLYRKMTLPRGPEFPFQLLSPKDIKAALENVPRSIRDVSGLAGQVFSRTDADYLLTFEVEGSAAAIGLKATLFDRRRKSPVGTMSQTGFNLERLPQRIMDVGTDLVLEAGSS
jgi:predicted anti-sigma-YlaC factor YlaD